MDLVLLSAYRSDAALAAPAAADVAVGVAGAALRLGAGPARHRR